MLTSLATVLLLAAKLEFVVPDANFSLREGLPAVQVLSLHQDRYGSLWAGTSAGLARLGGPTIRTYGAEQGLARASVLAVGEGPSGDIVVGTAGGVSRLNGERFESMRLPPAAADLSIRRFVRSRDGVLWALAGDRTILRLMAGTWQTVGIDGALAFEATDLALDDSGALWVATRNHGLIRFAPAGTRLQRSAQFEVAAKAGIAIDHVVASRGRVYFTSAHGLSVVTWNPLLSTGGLSTMPFPSGLGAGHRSLSVTAAGRVFIGTNAGVLTVRDGRIEPAESRNDRARAPAVVLLSDREGQLWIGTTESGLNVLLLGRGVRFLRSEKESFRTIDLDKSGAHWVSNERRVLTFRTDDDGTPRAIREPRFEGFDALTLFGIAESADGSLRFAIDGGVALLKAGDRNSPSAVVRPDPGFEALRGRLVTGIYADARGTLWAVSPLGVFRLRRDEAEAQSVPLPGGTPWMASLDSSGHLWIATRQGGMVCLDTATGTPVPVSLPSGRHVEFLGIVPDGGVVATFENGQSAFFTANDAGVIAATAAPQAISWLSVLSLQKMGDLYLAAHGGDRLSQISLERGRVEQTILTSADLEDSDFRYLTLREGRAGQMWFTLLNGIGLLDPPNAPPEPTRLRLEPDVESILLAPRPNTMEIHVELSDPVAPRKARYRYRLVGESDEWSAWTSDPHLPLNNIAPGTYRLEVEAEDRYGRRAAPVGVDVTARAHLWESWPARVAAGLLLLGLAYRFYQQRVRAIEQERLDLAAAVKAGRTDLEAANQRLQELSLTDMLTGLRNRRFFSEVVAGELGLLRRRYDDRVAAGEPNRDAVFFLLDLDRFKTVNDLFGHAGGDAVLKESARRLSAFLRKTDRLIRWGGEEFLVLSLDCQRDQAADLAARMMEAISEQPYPVGPPGGLHITTSIGWAAYPFSLKEPEPHPEDVVQIVDRALYRAKRAGRNCAVGIAPAGPDTPAPLGTAEVLHDLGVTVYFTTVRGPARSAGEDLTSLRGTGPIRRPH